MKNTAWVQTTTMEKLEAGGCPAVLKYNENVLVVGHGLQGYRAAVYEFIETPEETGLGDIECRLNLVEAATEHFTDSGHAMVWCMAQI